MQRDGMKGKKALSGLCLAAAVLVIIWVSWRNGIVNYYLVSTLALLLSLAAFFLSYERKSPPPKSWCCWLSSVLWQS